MFGTNLIHHSFLILLRQDPVGAMHLRLGTVWNAFDRDAGGAVW